MLETLASPDSVLWISLALVAAGAAALLLRCIRAGETIAAVFSLLCGVLAVLCSSHYLLFIWASDMYRSLPGLLLGLPLIYASSIALLAPRQSKRPLGAAFVLAAGLALLLLVDSQQLWPATFYRLQASIMGYPDLVLHTGEDLGRHVPVPGTRVIFQPTGQELSCGLVNEPEPRHAAALPFSVDCLTYYWGRAMVSPSHAALTEVPALYGLAVLWREDERGRYSRSLGATLTPLAMADFQLLCPAGNDCLASKQALMTLFGHERWPEFLDWMAVEDGQLSRVYDGLSYDERESLIEILAPDIRAQLDKRVAGIVAVYTDAQARSLSLRDLAPRYSSPRSLTFIDDSVDVWNKLKSTLRKLPVEIPRIGTLGNLQNAVIVAVEQPEDGSVRLLYHTEVGRQSVTALVFFIAPLLWLVLVLLVLLSRCVRPKEA